MQFLAVLALVASVEGIVQNGGTPLPGCTVTLTAPSGTTHRVVSGVDGRYRLGGLNPGLYAMQIELAGLETIERDITVVADSENVQPVEEMKIDSDVTEITLACGGPPCTGHPPESIWDDPACADYELDEALLSAIERGDRSALDLARRRHDSATTYAQKHRLAAGLLRRVPNDSVYWNELFQHAENHVRFAGAREQLEQWCAERDYPADDYWNMSWYALDKAAADPRARPLLLRALKVRDDVDVIATAIAGLSNHRDERDLAAIKEALDANPDDAGHLATLLELFKSEAADQLAFRYMDAEQREWFAQYRASLQ